MFEASQETSSGRDILNVPFRHKGKVAAFFLSVVVAATLYCLIAEDAYESSAQLLVRVGRESISIDPTAATGKTLSVIHYHQNEINSEIQILTSQELAGRVVDSIGPARILEPGSEARRGGRPPGALATVQDRLRSATKALKKRVREIREEYGILVGDQTDREKAVIKLMDSLDVENLANTYVIMVSYKAPTRELSQRVVEELVRLYLAKHVEVYSTSGAYDFFKRQTGELQQTIDAKESMLRRRKQQTKIVSLETQRSTIAERIASLQKSIADTQTEMAVARTKLAKIQEMSRSSANHRGVRLLYGEGAENAEKSHIDLLEAQIAALNEELAAVQEGRTKLNQFEFGIGRLEHEIQLDKDSHQKYTENLEQARIDQALEMEKISNISVVEPPTYPMEKAWPLPLLILALAVAFGVGGGVGLAFVAEHLDHSLKRAAEVDRSLSLPTLATIPLSRGHLGRRRRHGPTTLGDPLEAPESVRRALEVLGERVLLLADQNPARPVLLGITSTGPGEGVSTLSSRLAIILARHDEKPVLLVDANLDDPKAHQILDGQPHPGLREALASGGAPQSAIQRTGFGTLDLLAAGQRNGDPTSLQDPSRFAALCDIWKRKYRFIIADLPSVGSANCSRLAGVADAVILVVESEQTRWEAARDARDKLLQARANVIGVVLNKRRYAIPGWLYRSV